MKDSLRLVVTLDNLPEDKREAIANAGAGRVEVIFAATAEDKARYVPETDILLGHVDTGLIERAQSLRWIQTGSAGVEGYLKVLADRDVVITNASGAYGIGISEHMTAMALMLLRRMPDYVRAKDRGQWGYLGGVRSIYDAKVVSVGMGDIGSNFARRMHAFGARVTGVRRGAAEKPSYVEALYTTEELDLALRDADIIGLSMPHTPETVGIISRERIFAMKQGAILLNIGRGSAIDQDALVDALREGRIYAGLDVTTPEPLPEGHPLWQMENALITPHISGGNSLGFTARFIADLFLRNLDAFLTGGPMENLVDRTRGY